MKSKSKEQEQQVHMKEGRENMNYVQITCFNALLVRSGVFELMAHIHVGL